MTSLNRTLLLKGTPEMLGLYALESPAPRTLAGMMNLVQFTSLAQAGMGSTFDFDDLQAYIIQNAKKAGIAQPYICVMHSGTRRDGDYFYDYPGPAFCNPTHVKAGDPYTSISFHEYVPREKPPGPWLSQRPDLVPNHNEWFIMLDTEDDTSHAKVSSGVCGKLKSFGHAFGKIGDFFAGI